MGKRGNYERREDDFYPTIAYKPPFEGLEPTQQPPATNVAALNATAARLGFGSREPAATMPLKRREPVDEPTFSFTARVSLKSGNAFIALLRGTAHFLPRRVRPGDGITRREPHRSVNSHLTLRRPRPSYWSSHDSFFPPSRT